MSKFINEIKAELIQKKGYKRNFSRLSVMQEVVSTPGIVRYEQDPDSVFYQIGVTYGIHGWFQPKDKEYMIDNVVQSLRHDIYGEFQTQLLQIEECLHKQENDMAKSIIRDVLNEAGL